MDSPSLPPSLLPALVPALPPALVKKIDAEEGSGAILVFLPGWEDITKVHETLQRLPQSRRWRLYPLHSQLPMDQQREIFSPPPPGLRKIVLATNIAESSITIDDVVYVLDGGKHKEKTYDAEKKVAPAGSSQGSAGISSPVESLNVI
ncbi:hypothetical protein NSK_008481 [Nannochloropsis salina CCMP1776]|uniref:Helicase C-terminal domain-containing protein n=1 Tax=Nannochloropsis salina CCMP1776 TaxID=1027361 RepID=A0A4D9CM44_9STRA|nr:hypothetical protein NSK_008481 [Nannochloropsis salina CCMP1776]|eukprot:TFJ80181.1 hypothetical protein NSK_008481 [Nannochloropsis salina CCMP1776]